MAYAQLDLGFHDHPKVIALLDEPDGLAAIGLWTLCLTWARDHADPDRTDDAGHIPPGLVRRLGGTDDLAATLGRVGLWDQNGSGWVIHQFAEWQDLALWQARREWGRTGGRPRSSRSKPSGNQEALFDRTSSPPYQNRTEQQQNRTTDKNQLVVGSATRLPTDFAPSSDSIASVARRRPDVDWAAETPKFAAYWQARPGKGGERKDWQATWRNWMGKARGTASDPMSESSTGWAPNE